MLVALDIETVCDVETCPGYGGYKKCKHALSPWHNRITVVGIWSPTMSRVFRTLDEFRVFVEKNPELRFVGHNLKFDLATLRAHGVPVWLEQWEHDTNLMAYVSSHKIPDSWLSDYERLRAEVAPHVRRGSKHSLKTLAPYFLEVDPFWETEDKDDDNYVLKDCEYSYRLLEKLTVVLKERDEYQFYHERQLPWAKMLVMAEERGIKIDEKELKDKENELIQKRDQLGKKLSEQWQDAHLAYRRNRVQKLSAEYLAKEEAAIVRLKDATPAKVGRVRARYQKLLQDASSKIPDRLDYESPAQMLWLLRTHLGYNCTTFEGKQSTGREVLERLADEGKKDVALFLEWRKVNKLLTAFLPTYQDLVINGEIHPTFSPAVTRTGRLSSERPNLQQVPPELRPLFKPRPGYVFLDYDYAGIEAVMIALVSNDPTLFELLNRKISVHDFNTVQDFELACKYDQVKGKYPQERKATKAVGFARFYHAGARRMQAAYANNGFMITYDECQRRLKRFKEESFPVAMGFAKTFVQHMENGEIMPNLFGRPVFVENPDDAYMKAFNKYVQSSASDLNLEGAYRTLNALWDNNIDAYPVLFVHDNNVIEVPESQAERANEIMINELTRFNLETDHGPLKLEVEGGIRYQWEK